MRHTVDSRIGIPCGFEALLWDGVVFVGGEVGDAVYLTAELGAPHGGGEVAVHAVPADGVVVGVVGFVLLVAPLAGGAVVARGVHRDAFSFEVVEYVVIGPMPHEEKLGRAVIHAADILGEWDAAFDEIDIGALLPVECGVPGPVEGAGGALEDIGEAAQVGLTFLGVLGAEAEDEGAVVAPLVILEEIKTGCAGLDVEAVLDGDAAGSVVEEGQVPLAGEEVAVGVAVAEAGFAPLHAWEPHAELEDEEVQHGGAVLASAPKDDGVAKFPQPILGSGQGFIDEVLQVLVH